MNHIPAALISTDAAFRATVRTVLNSAGGFTLAAEVNVPFVQVADAELKQLRDAQPELLVIDLADDPAVGLKLAQFLADQRPEQRLIAAGPELSPELLMAAMRAGITEYLPKPVAPEALAEALRRTERKLGRANGAAAREPGTVLSLFSAKGGSGSTTVATNLAIHLRQLTGKRTLLVDLDLELGEVALFLGAQPRFNLVDLVRNFHRMDAELLASYIEEHASGVHLLSAPYQPERVEAVSAEQIRTILGFLRQHYDYVVVDTPKTFTPATLATFEAADRIYLVTAVDLPSLRNIKRFAPLLDRITGGHLKEKVRLVVNRHDASATEISDAEVERTLGLPIHWRVANDYESVIRSINAGIPLLLDGKASAVARDLRALGAEIAGLAPVAGNGRVRLSGLKRLFRPSREAAHE
jgi:pilus assembly protein CpaE